MAGRSFAAFFLLMCVAMALHDRVHKYARDEAENMNGHELPELILLQRVR